MQGTSLAVGCEQGWWLAPCVGQMDGWMGDMGKLSACEPGRELYGTGCEQGRLWEGMIQGIH